MVLETSPAVCTYGAEVIQRNLSAFRKEIPGVLKSRDIEYVHRLRVASRRLDMAVVVFQSCHTAKRVKTWQKELHQIARILGRARDLDIQAACVKDFLKRSDSAELRPGVRRLVLRVMQKRKRVQGKLLDALKSLEKRHTLESLEVRSGKQVESQKILNDRNLELIITFAGLKIQPVLEDFLSYDSFVDHVEAVEELHAMRIAAKKLRYTLECFSVVFKENLTDYLATMRTIQDQLGMIHDCDVWQSSGSRFIEEERRFTEEYFGSNRGMKRLMPGFLAFFEDRAKQRVMTYNAFLGYWHDLRKADFWNELGSQIGLKISG
jgi:CHAD domain-containing protein